ncbi:hypothetical protein GGR53DRAFT_502971 [Hypoxylon sp. FL1150]|nr:hypothetical protein GGR53DRAFT_502971 [Hypoxylon sp. FL1150]
MPKPWKSTGAKIPPVFDWDVAIKEGYPEPCTRDHGHDDTCRVIASFPSLDSCRIIPLSEEKWYNQSDVEKYTERRGGLKSGSNTVTVRSDIHRLLDYSYLVILPKSCPLAPDKYTWVTHVLNAPHLEYAACLEFDEIVSQYHNRECQPFKGVTVELLFAGFAWSLFNEMTMPLFTIPGPGYWDREFAVFLRKNPADYYCHGGTMVKPLRPGSSPRKGIRKEDPGREEKDLVYSYHLDAVVPRVYASDNDT